MAWFHQLKLKRSSGINQLKKKNTIDNIILRSTAEAGTSKKNLEVENLWLCKQKVFKWSLLFLRNHPLLFIRIVIQTQNKLLYKTVSKIKFLCKCLTLIERLLFEVWVFKQLFRLKLKMCPFLHYQKLNGEKCATIKVQQNLLVM